MENIIKTKVDFFTIQRLFDEGWNNGNGWKSHYFREAQDCFKKHFEPLNKWKPNPMDPEKFGHYSDDNLWSWTNRINTHPNCCLSFYKWATKYNPNIFIDFGNPSYHEYNAKKMWEFVDNFFDLIFTTDTTDKYLRELKVKCQKSWNNGNLTMISILQSLEDAFGDVSDIDYTFDFGDGDDMNGVDLSFKLTDGSVKTMQIKSGKYLNMGDEFHVTGSPNDLKYKTDYYGYSNIDNWKGFTSILIFNNVPELKKDGDTIVIKKGHIIYHKIKNMPIPEKLNELLILCGKNDVEFILKKENETNEVHYDNETKKVTINFVDVEDKELETLLSNKINELKELFK
jgi:hypothetical protein